LNRDSKQFKRQYRKRSKTITGIPARLVARRADAETDISDLPLDLPV